MHRFVVSLAALFLLTLCSFASAQEGAMGGDDAAPLPQEDARERFEWFGQSLHYSIEILGAEAARTAIQVGQPMEVENYGTVIPVDGLTVSVGFFGTVYPIHDTALTYLNPDTGLPVYSSKVLDERGEVRSYDVTYRQRDHRADVVRTRGGTQRYYRLVPSDLHDAMSWMLDLRSRDLSVGAEYVYHVYDGWKLSRLTARITAHTDVYTAMGYIDCAEMTFTREVLASFALLPFADSAPLPPVYEVTDGPIELGRGWFSIDERRLPVGVEIAAPIGDLRMIIDRIE